MAQFRYPVEVSVLLIFFVFMLTESIYTNLIVYRTCYITLGRNKTECALLGNANDNSEERQKLEKLVEPIAAVINTIRFTIEGLFTSVICMFIGPWSDRYGRKPVLTVTFLGFTLSYLCIAIFSFFTNVSPWFSILCSIPLILSGGSATFLTVSVAYITDSSDENNRGTRMAIFEGMLTLGILLGNISGPYIFYATNYPSVFLIASLTCAIGLLHTICLVPESLETRDTEDKLRNLFKMTNLTDMIKATVKKRNNYKRSIVLLCVAILVTYIFLIYGDGSVTFFFLRSKFGWSLTKYQIYSSIHNVVWILGTILGTVFLHRILKVTESVLVLMGLLAMMDCTLMLALATADWHIYASIGIRLLGGMISPMTRSLVSKTVSGEEVGKIFSMIMVCEFVFGLGASPLYTLIYNKTIDKDPATFNFLTAGLYGLCAVFTIIIMCLQFITLRNNNYGSLKNEEEEEEDVIGERENIIN